MYKIVLKKKAKKFIDKLPLNEKKRIVAAIEKLPEGEDIKKLQGYDNVLRLRVGTYRIIYTVDNGKLIITVIDAGNRGQIYKRLYPVLDYGRMDIRDGASDRRSIFLYSSISKNENSFTLLTLRGGVSISVTPFRLLYAFSFHF